MKDCLIEFTFNTEAAKTDEITDPIIAIVERVHSSVGGGCGSADGEFFIATGDGFGLKDLLDVLAVLLPHVASLSVKAVAKETEEMVSK